MMPLNGSGKCYPLFEQGPCNHGEWFVLNSANNVTLLPYAQCEKILDCDVFTLKEDFEGKNILCANFQFLRLMKGIFGTVQISQILLNNEYANFFHENECCYYIHLQ